MTLVPLYSISMKMFFLLKGVVDVKYLRSKIPLVNYREGGYFGEVSLLFSLKNKYTFTPRPHSSVFSLKQVYLKEMLERYPEFKQMLEIRGLRRHRYLRKLKRQAEALAKIRALQFSPVGL